MTPEQIKQLAAEISKSQPPPVDREALKDELRRELQNEAIDGAKGDRSGPFDRAPAVTDVKPVWEQARDARNARQAKSANGANPFGLYTLAWLRADGAKAGAGGPDKARLASELKSLFGVERSKSLQESVFAAGGAGVPTPLSSDWIDALVAAPALARLGAQRLNFKSTLTIGRTDSLPTASWTTEGAQMTASTPATGAIVLSAKKLFVYTHVSNDLIRNPDAQYSSQRLSQDMINAAAQEMENQFINGTGASSKPLGLLAQIHSTQRYTKAGTSIANYLADVNKLVKAVDDTNRPREKRAFLMGTALESTLLNLYDTTAGFVPFRQEMLEKGTLRGFPYAVSTQMPSTHLVFGEFSDMILGIDTEIELMAGSPRFDFDETSYRLVARVDAAVRRAKSFASITDY